MMKKRKQDSMILTGKLEKMSKKIFSGKEYKKIINKRIGNRSGVYALYDDKELYYVGRASDLATRVNDHLKNKHSALWTHFSVYFTEAKNDLEAVIIAIAKPKGNTTKPKLKLKEEKKLKTLINQDIQKSQKEERELLGLEKKQHPSKKKSKKRPNLKNYFEKSKPLMKTYKGKTYKATLLKSGKIKYKNKIYNSPSSVARVIVSKYSPKSQINGWNFWSVKNNDNNWVKLADLD